MARPGGMMESNADTTVLLLFWLAALALNGLLGYWAGKVGERKGRSFGLCFCLGFFLGLIGVLIVYVIGSAYDSSPASRRVAPLPGRDTPPDPYQQRTMVCGKCGKLVEGGARFCPYCGNPQQGMPGAP